MQKRSSKRLAQSIAVAGFLLSAGWAGAQEASAANIADDEHDPEGSTIAYERTQIGALIEQAERHLVEIDAALQRIADGGYGRCEVCGEAIPDERLRARPTARTCMSHAGTAVR